MKKNDIMKKYIITKYGSISKFLRKEKFSPQYLEIMLDKKDVFHQIGIGIRVCGFLNINAVKLFCNNQIALTEKAEKEITDADLSLDEIIKQKYAELDKDKRKKVLDYANHIFESIEM